jgi:hypothetical protein
MTNILRKGLMATSLSAALVLGGAAFAQTATPQEQRGASPSATQSAPSTMPDQDNAARPMPDKDNNAAREQDRDQNRDRDAKQDRDRDNSASGMNDHDTNKREIKLFDSFLDSHPEVAKDLEKDPNRVNDPGFVSNHKELQRFLEDHPKVREELKENPSAFMNREKKNEKSEQKY